MELGGHEVQQLHLLQSVLEFGLLIEVGLIEQFPLGFQRYKVVTPVAYGPESVRPESVLRVLGPGDLRVRNLGLSGPKFPR